MLKLFQNNMVVQVIVLLLAVLLLWGRSLLSPVPMAEPTDSAPLYGWLYGWLHSFPLLCVIIAMVLIVVEAVELNMILSDIGLVPQTSLLPSFLYILFMSAGTATLTPMVLVNGVLIICVSQLLLHGTLLTIPVGKICNATALIGICTMLYQPALGLLVAYLLVVINYRLYGWRDWAVLLLGFLAPYVLYSSVLLAVGGLRHAWEMMLSTLGGFAFRVGEYTVLEAIANLFLVVIGSAGVVRFFALQNERTVVWQKNASAVMASAVAGLVMLGFTSFFLVNFSFFAVPFTQGCSLFFVQRKRRTWILDILLLLAFISAMVC